MLLLNNLNACVTFFKIKREGMPLRAFIFNKAKNRVIANLLIICNAFCLYFMEENIGKVAVKHLPMPAVDSIETT